MQSELEKLESAATEVVSKLAEAREKIATREEPIRTKIEEFVQLEKAAKKFRTFCNELESLHQKFSNLKPKIRESLETRRRATRRYSQNLQLLARHFEYALSEISGGRVDTNIRIDANGISPSFTSDTCHKGAALGTSAVLAFDLSCLTASIEGMGHHPRFIFHDSPRDADMEEPLYHRLFDFVAGLEDLFDGDPSFQYIITTTTMPPKHLVKSEKKYVRLTLNRGKNDGLLLKQQF